MGGFEHLTYTGPLARSGPVQVDRPYEPEWDLVQAPQYRDLTTLVRVKSEVLKSDGSPSSDDGFIATLIADVSDAISWACRRTFYRAQFTEVIVGDGNEWLVPDVTPLARLISITEESGDTVDLTEEVEIHSRKGIRRKDGRYWLEGYRYTVDYVGGWLLPNNDMATQSVEVASSLYRLTSGSVAWPTNIVTGADSGIIRPDFVAVSGWSNAVNNGTWAVASISGTDLTPTGASLTTEAAAVGQKLFGFRTLPREVERAAIEMTKNIYLSRDRDGMVQRISKQSLNVQWFEQALPSRSVHWLQGYARPESPAWRMLNAS